MLLIFELDICNKQADLIKTISVKTKWTSGSTIKNKTVVITLVYMI
jgi:hypothetical protein